MLRILQGDMPIFCLFFDLIMHYIYLYIIILDAYSQSKKLMYGAKQSCISALIAYISGSDNQIASIVYSPNTLGFMCSCFIAMGYGLTGSSLFFVGN
jgi:hypothetical protein